jgi:prepilin-type N-terminal cleavage/methylation domain-containing protein
MNCRGFTITELMIAMLLFSLLVTGGLAAWAQGGAAWHEARIEQVLHERAQYVFATLEPELQMAGFFGGLPPPAPLAATSIPAGAQRCGLTLVQRLDMAVEVAPAYQLPCPAHGGGAADGSMQLIVRRASAHPAVATPGRAQWLSSWTHGRTVWNDGPAAATAAGLERRDLLLRVYYVARAADGDADTPALRMKSLASIAGNPTFIDTEVMPGVEDLQARILPSADAPRSVRITLTVRADQTDRRAGQALRRLTVTRTFTLRNASGS